MVEAAAMPRRVRAAKWLLLFGLAAHAALFGYGALMDTERSPASSVMAAMCMVAAVGLWRGVVWGRGLTSIVWVILCLRWTAFFFSPPDDSYASIPLNVLAGAEIPVWMLVFLTMAFAALMLVPLLMIGWNRDYFRKAVW
jgi:hypothetical protein